jgi:hypothetical protein
VFMSVIGHRCGLTSSQNATAQVPLTCASLVNKPMAALAPWTLRDNELCRLLEEVAVDLGYCSKSEVQQVNVSQRKALGASTAVFKDSFVDKAMTGLATWALR